MAELHWKNFKYQRAPDSEEHDCYRQPLHQLRANFHHCECGVLYLEVLTFVPFTENLRRFTGVASVVGPPCPFLLLSSRRSRVVAAMNILKGYKKDDEECKAFTLLRFLRHTKMAAIFFLLQLGGTRFCAWRRVLFCRRPAPSTTTSLTPASAPRFSPKSSAF